MSVIDSLDQELARLLGQDAQQNSEILAKQLNVSSATVRRRLKKLTQSGSLRIIAVVEPAMFGLPLSAIIALDVAYDKLKSAVEALANRPEITWMATATGRFDILARARFASSDHLSKFVMDEVSMIDGIRNSETFICLDVKKGREIALP